MSENKLSYKDVTSNHLTLSNEPVTVEEDDNPLERDLINLSVEEITSLYDPWKFSMIINPVRKNFVHQYLKIKLKALWKTLICLIDLWSGFYTVKFEDQESQPKSLQGGSWFIDGTFISVRKWECNFIPSRAQIDFTAIWLRLSQLSTEFYDTQIL